MARGPYQLRLTADRQAALDTITAHIRGRNHGQAIDYALARTVEMLQQEEHRMTVKLHTIDSKEITIDGETMTVDLIIENADGRWYGVDLGWDGERHDWEYAQDNGEYIPAE